MPEVQEIAPPTLNVRLGTELRVECERLAQQANFENPNQFFRAVIKHLVEIADGEPFDVRDLVLKGKKSGVV